MNAGLLEYLDKTFVEGKVPPVLGTVKIKKICLISFEVKNNLRDARQAGAGKYILIEVSRSTPSSR